MCLKTSTLSLDQSEQMLWHFSLVNIVYGHKWVKASLLSRTVKFSFKFQFRHKSDQQVNNRLSQVLVRGRYFTLCLSHLGASCNCLKANYFVVFLFVIPKFAEREMDER